jgi:hypothetical protein
MMGIVQEYSGSLTKAFKIIIQNYHETSECSAFYFGSSLLDVDADNIIIQKKDTTAIKAIRK